MSKKNKGQKKDRNLSATEQEAIDKASEQASVKQPAAVEPTPEQKIVEERIAEGDEATLALLKVAEDVEASFADRLKAKKALQKLELQKMRDAEKARKEAAKKDKVGKVTSDRKMYTRVDGIVNAIKDAGYMFPKSLELLTTKADGLYSEQDGKKSNPKETAAILAKVVPTLIKLGFAKVDGNYVIVAQLTDLGWVFPEAPKEEEAPAPAEAPAAE